MKPLSVHILIGLLAALATAAIVPAATGAQPAKGSHNLIFRLSGQGHQNVIGSEAVVISVHCPIEACTVVASATSSSPSVHTARVRAKVKAGGTERLTLSLPSSQTAKLKAALKAGHSPTLIVHATAHDGAGNRIPLSLKVRAEKP